MAKLAVDVVGLGEEFLLMLIGAGAAVPSVACVLAVLPVEFGDDERVYFPECLPDFAAVVEDGCAVAEFCLPTHETVDVFDTVYYEVELAFTEGYPVFLFCLFHLSNFLIVLLYWGKHILHSICREFRIRK